MSSNLASKLLVMPRLNTRMVLDAQKLNPCVGSYRQSIRSWQGSLRCGCRRMNREKLGVGRRPSNWRLLAPLGNDPEGDLEQHGSPCTQRVETTGCPVETGTRGRKRDDFRSLRTKEICCGCAPCQGDALQ